MEDSSFTIPADDNGDSELDPRIQDELEKLNAATAEINKLELELDESTKRFHVLLADTSKRLQALSKKLGTCVEKSRPYYEALAVAATARTECQKAAVQFQRASELHDNAKSTVTKAEQRFASKHDEWQFDSNWQEVLNHAIIKVMDAEKRKAESGREHQKKAADYIAAEKKVTKLEDSLKRNIIKSRFYFEEKKLCDEQLQSQTEKISKLQQLIAEAKSQYARSLKALEEISEEIHRLRGDFMPDKDTIPVGPREPGVGAEKEPDSEDNELSLEQLRLRVLKPIDSIEIETDDAWTQELNETINKLDQLLMMKEGPRKSESPKSLISPPTTSKEDSWSLKDNQALNEIKVSEKSKSMVSLDVLALARDANMCDRESYLRAAIDKSPSVTYTESNSEVNESSEDILMVECDSSDSANPVIRMTGSARTDSVDS